MEDYTDRTCHRSCCHLPIVHALGVELPRHHRLCYLWCQPCCCSSATIAALLDERLLETTNHYCTPLLGLRLCHPTTTHRPPHRSKVKPLVTAIPDTDEKLYLCSFLHISFLHMSYPRLPMPCLCSSLSHCLLLCATPISLCLCG